MFSLASLFGSKKEDIYAPVWQDREIRFDAPLEALALRRGEIAFERLDGVEDVKGGSGDHGRLTLTNLRLLWTSDRAPGKLNLSIGLGCITGVTERTAHNKVRGTLQALQVFGSFQGARFDFVFAPSASPVRAPSAAPVPSTAAASGSGESSGAAAGGAGGAAAPPVPAPPEHPVLFLIAAGVLQSYQASRLYRELKLRGAIVAVPAPGAKEKSLIMLPGEKLVSKLDGVWNLAAEQGNLGVSTTTTLRFTWFASMAENFNVSVPFLQMVSIRIRESRFGPALVIETRPKPGAAPGSGAGGGYLLGFRLDPPDRLSAVAQELKALWQAAHAAPHYGVERPALATGADGAAASAAAAAAASALAACEDPEAAISAAGARSLEAGGDAAGELGDAGDAYATYLADGGMKEADRPVIFSRELGLAVETPPEGLTIDRLWVAL